MHSVENGSALLPNGSSNVVRLFNVENRMWLMTFPFFILTLNGSVLLTLHLRPVLRKNPFLVFSTLTHALLGSVSVPLRVFFRPKTLVDSVDQTSLPTAPCLVVIILQFYCVLQTIVAAAFVSVDRYLLFTTRRDRYRRWMSKKHNPIIAIVASILACFTLLICPVFDALVENATGSDVEYRTYCDSHYVMIPRWLIAVVVCHIAVTMVVVVVNGCLASYLLKVRRSVNPNLAINNRATIQGAIICLVMNIAFLVLWLPLIVVFIVDSYCNTTKLCDFANMSYRYPAVLAMIYSCTQPLILIGGSTKLRQAMKSVFLATPLTTIRRCTTTHEEIELGDINQHG